MVGGPGRRRGSRLPEGLLLRLFNRPRVLVMVATIGLSQVST